MIRVRLTIVGDVQGVGYRRFARKKARELALGGFVRNLADGSVEAHVQGNEETVNRFIQWSYQGAPSSVVKNVVVEALELVPGDEEFIIRE